MVDVSLNRCPHCGGEAEYGFNSSHDANAQPCHYVICQDCPANMEAFNTTKEYVVAAWNKRTPVIAGEITGKIDEKAWAEVVRCMPESSDYHLTIRGALAIYEGARLPKRELIIEPEKHECGGVVKQTSFGINPTGVCQKCGGKKMGTWGKLSPVCTNLFETDNRIEVQGSENG